MNKDKIKNLFLLVLLFVTIIMGGYLVYDKVLNEDKNIKYDCNNDYNYNDSDKQQDNDVIVNKFPNRNGDEVLLAGNLFRDLLDEEQRKLVDLSKNFKNVKFTLNNIPITYDCLSFHDEEDNESLSRCTDATVFINNHKLTIDNWVLGCGIGRDIIYTDNYLIYRVISSCTQTGDIEIYDKNHNVLTKIDNVTVVYNKDDNGVVVDNSFRVFNNKLYFVSYDTHGKDDSMGIYGDTDFYYTYIDLNDSNYKVTTFEKLEH